MTMEEQPQALEQSYAQFHRMTTQPWRTEQDRSDALQTLKGREVRARTAGRDQRDGERTVEADPLV